VTVPGLSADRARPRDARPPAVLIVEDDAGIATQLARGRRKSLGEPRLIETVSGRGFRLADPR
jgi:hypothetical protein